MRYYLLQANGEIYGKQIILPINEIKMVERENQNQYGIFYSLKTKDEAVYQTNELKVIEEEELIELLKKDITPVQAQPEVIKVNV